MIKQRWKTLRDNFKRELTRQQQIRSGSSGKQGRMYCHYYELEFLKPVMQDRQTESNINSESEAEEISTENTNIEPEEENDEEDVRETLEPPRQSTSRAKPKKNQQTQEFIEVVRNLIDSQKSENSEISAFTKSLIPQIALVKQEYQCDLRIELMKVIKSFQQKSNTQAPEMPNPQHHHYGNPWEEPSYRAPSFHAPCGSNMSMTPQYNRRFIAGQYDMPPNYYPPMQGPPPPPPPTPPNTAREDSHPHTSFYQDL
ncbi:uncharacterized protein [Aquarana catesbeiana]|uniref:uncharacterized protein n=1 Tax=Aquarana catesbeiana TaxID=8400 RepID=UPI003CC9835D